MANTNYTPISVSAVGASGVAGTQTIDPGDTSGVVYSTVFQLANQSSLSAIPRITMIQAAAAKAGPGLPLVTGTNVQYLNLATGAVLSAGTAITTNGIFAVYAPGCQVELITSAGTADCYVQHVLGRVF